MDQRGDELFRWFYTTAGFPCFSIILELGAAAPAHGAAALMAHAGQSVTGPALPSLTVADE